MTLKELPIGKMATVLTVGGEGALRQHFLDMGIIPSAQVTMVKYAPMGDPVEVRIHSYELTLRLEDAEKIEIGQIQDAVTKTRTPNQKIIDHPGSACRQFPGCDRRPERWCDPRPQQHPGDGSSWYLFHVPVFQRGTGNQAVCTG